MLHIVLVEPEIPPNTGNIIRLAANTGFQLHLIQPLGFHLDNTKLKRAGLDYHEFAKVAVYNAFEDFIIRVQPNKLWALSSKVPISYATVSFSAGDALIFGPETRGLTAPFLEKIPEPQRITIPMVPGGRSLNLSNAVAVVAYEAWKQLAFLGSSASHHSNHRSR